MAELLKQDPDNTVHEVNAMAHENELAKVRSLLFGGDVQQLQELKNEYDDPRQFAEHVASVISEAVTERSRQDDSFFRALQPNVEKAIQASVKQNPQPLVDALFPVIGPAIRKAISQALNQMMQTLNSLLENSFSARSLKWRFQAWRTGKPYAEIVLLHSLIYQVEQVFLIQKETGLLLQHVVSERAITNDPDMISGMLTAIQDFIADSFKVRTQDGLHSMSVGGLTILVKQGPEAVLAAVIRGVAPKTVGTALDEALEQIHADYAKQLYEYTGDSSVFDSTRELLQACLLFQAKLTQPNNKQLQANKKKRRWIIWSIVVLLFSAIALWAYYAYRDYSAWQQIVNQLRQEPGYVVLHASTENGYRIDGLREPMARDTQEVLSQDLRQALAVTWNWQPYLSMESDFVVRRAAIALQAPPTVSMRMHDNTLSVSGEAPKTWIDNLKTRAILVTGVGGIDISDLFPLQRRQQLIDQINNQVFYFPSGADALGAAEQTGVVGLGQAIQELQHIADIIGISYRIQIQGHTDQDGVAETNEAISRTRADSIKQMLVDQGLDGSTLATVGLGAQKPARLERSIRDKQFNRRVTFSVEDIKQ